MTSCGDAAAAAAAAAAAEAAGLVPPPGANDCRLAVAHIVPITKQMRIAAIATACVWVSEMLPTTV